MSFPKSFNLSLYADKVSEEISIEKTDLLIGCKRVVLIGKVLYVSPAIWSLLDESSSEELNHLMENLVVMNYSKYKNIVSVPESLMSKTQQPV